MSDATLVGWALVLSSLKVAFGHLVLNNNLCPGLRPMSDATLFCWSLAFSLLEMAFDHLVLNSNQCWGVRPMSVAILFGLALVSVNLAISPATHLCL